MKKQLFILSSVCLALTACDHGQQKSGHAGSQQNRTPTSYAADDTGLNIRDRDHTLTAGDQSENEMDRTITQKIRQAVMEDDSLSTYGKNIKIITVNGVVTLRGPVNNERERMEIAQKTRGVAGVRNVDNQIEVMQGSRTVSSSSGSMRN